MSLITPLDPGSSRGERAARPPVEVQQCVHTTLFGRIASAVASSSRQRPRRQRRRAQRTRSLHGSVRRRRRRRWRRDGGDGEPPAGRASARGARDRSHRREDRVPGHARRRPRDRAEHRAAHRCAGRGDGGAVRAAQRAGVEMADRVGRRLPCLPALRRQRSDAACAHRRRQLRALERDAAARQLGGRSGAHGRQRRGRARRTWPSPRWASATCSSRAATACTSISKRETGAGF